MIDLHTHILPNIDDGSRSIDETFELIKEAQNAGFKSVVLTSHYMEGYYETNLHEREVLTNLIQNNFREKNIDIDVYIGNEIYMSDNLIKLLESGKASTINNTSYVLFEMPLNVEPYNLYDIIYQMQQNKIVPILAHPERYSFIQKDLELMYDLIEKGVLMQANFGSIIGQYGKKAQKTVRTFLNNNMIHLLGSDAHRHKTIYPRIPEAIKELEKLISTEKLKELTTTNPELILNNKKINIEEPNRIELTIKDKLLGILGRK